ncbi:MAG: outer membrane beta-barrel protein [Bdellovibrionaceae bacterium]|nr:outer membrane beta-barrel protein [Bdellovibrionales bacterium]MCB9082826.1 outer membrane beta-barrel protein [Pseudobdellovibrionaceae bacterium]
MKFWALALALLIWAPLQSRAASSETTYDIYNHAVYGTIGFARGGLVIGGEYEYPYDRTFGLGGLARYYSKDKDKGEPSVFVIGGFVRPHFNRREWDLYVSPGFNLMMIDGNNNDETVLGPSLSFGLLYQMKRTMAMGVDHTVWAGWFNDDFRGVILTDLMFKMRFSF